MNRIVAALVGRIRGFTTKTKSPAYRFCGRIGQDQIQALAEESLGRRLSRIEIDAIERGFRPQGLLDPDDGYQFALASAAYQGCRAPVISVFTEAVSGYADGDATLEVVESAAIHFRDCGVDVFDIVTAAIAA